MPRVGALPSIVVTVAGLLMGGAFPAAAAPVAGSAPSVVGRVWGVAADEVPDGAALLGSAAALGAGDAAWGAVADDAEQAGAAIGGVAVTVTPAGKTLPPSENTVSVGSGPTWVWHGWVSGASGPETLDGSFEAFRGESLGLIGAWADRSAAAQTEIAAVESLSGFGGQLDIAVGILVSGETWEQAADGQFTTRWTTAVRRLKAMRGGKGTTYIRIGHEMNGDWMVWGVNSKNLAAYKKAYRLYASIVRKEFPAARLTWSPNGGNHTDISIDDLWPGSDIVDVIGPDIYDFDPDGTTAASWKKEANAWLTPHSPTGLEAWRKYAERRGKPIALPEWGLASGDDPEWIRRVHDVMARNAAGKGSRNVSGKFVYDCYFNAEQKFKVLGGPNAQAGIAYADLTWGR